MRPRRRTRQSVDSVLAEERREWERSSLPSGPIHHRPTGVLSPAGEAVARLLPAVVLVVLGVTGGLAADQPETGAAAGVVCAVLWNASLRARR